MDSKPSVPFAEAALSNVTPTAQQITYFGAEAMKDIAYGSLAGMVGKMFEYPFDTVKVRLQSQPDHLPLRYAGPLDCLKQGIQHDGIKGLYRGVSAPLIGAAAETACLFFAYRVAQGVLRATVLPERMTRLEKLPVGPLVVAGAMSGAVTSLILTPIELVKCRMQVPLSSSADLSLGPKNGFHSTTLSPRVVIGDVYRREGLAGFWRGQLGTLLRETGGGAAWFGFYEIASLYFRKRAQFATGQENPTIPLYQSMIAGAGAGVSYNFSFYPADTIKSKIQTGDLADIGGNNTKQSFMGVGKALYRAHGMKGLYRGAGITMLRSAPSSALIFTLYEFLRETFG